MRIGLICGLVWAILSCNVSHAEDKAYPVTIQSTQNIDTALYQDDKGKSVYVEFLDSEKLTKHVRKSFQDAGYQLANDPSAAQVTYRFDGAFQGFRKITARLGEIKAGPYYEKPKVKTTKINKSFGMLFGLNPIAMVGGSILMNIGIRTSLHDNFNSMFGDPDGICLGECVHMKYAQRGVLRIRRTEGGQELIDAYIADANEKQLLAGELFQVTEQRLRDKTSLPFPVTFKGESTVNVVDAPQAAEPQTPAESSSVQ